MEAQPTTLYGMLGESCRGACQFCAQARDSEADPKFLSRIAWPEFDLPRIIDRLDGAPTIKRICIQTLRSAGIERALVNVVRTFRTVTALPISVCMNPTDPIWLSRLKAVGVNRVGVGLDCATEETFNAVKPGFDWERYHGFLDAIVETFGTGSVHLIVGVGDSDQDIVRKIQEAKDRGCTVALFAFTPVRGTRLNLPAPEIGRYRVLQLARYLITSGRARDKDMVFGGGRLIGIEAAPEAIDRALSTGIPFRTSGCPDCNRPLYNERPGGPMYNYATLLSDEEKARARHELHTYLVPEGERSYP